MFPRFSGTVCWEYVAASGRRSGRYAEAVAAGVPAAGAGPGLLGPPRGRGRVAELRPKNRQLELENDILKRAAAYFARESVLLK